MSVKFAFLFFGILLLTQCILANAEKESAKDLIETISKSFITFTDGVIASTQNNFEPIISAVQSNQITVDPKTQEKLVELKKYLEKASQSEHHELFFEVIFKGHILEKLWRIVSEIKDIQLDITDPTDGDKAVSQADEKTRNYIDENVAKFSGNVVVLIEEYIKQKKVTGKVLKKLLAFIKRLVEFGKDPNVKILMRLLKDLLSFIEF